MGKTSGKLGTLGTNGRVSEGDPRKAYIPTGTSEAISLLPVSPASAYTITGTVNKVPATFTVDMGTAVTLLSKGLWDKVKEEGWWNPCPRRGHVVPFLLLNEWSVLKTTMFR